MTGSGETAWMTPITMTYLPVKSAAGGRLFGDNRLKETRAVITGGDVAGFQIKIIVCCHFQALILRAG